MHLWRYVTTRFPANIERSSLKTSMYLYCDVTLLCNFGALKSYLFLVLSRVPLIVARNVKQFLMVHLLTKLSCKSSKAGTMLKIWQSVHCNYLERFIVWQVKLQTLCYEDVNILFSGGATIPIRMTEVGGGEAEEDEGAGDGLQRGGTIQVRHSGGRGRGRGGRGGRRWATERRNYTSTAFYKCSISKY